MPTALQEINTDIWLPFSAAYAAAEVDRYLALHAPEFVWVRAATRTILGLTDYEKNIRESFADLAGRGVAVRIEFRFTERIASAELASERGVFRMNGTAPDGPKPTLHGRFHTLARRGADRWHFIADYEDSAPTTADDYAAAHPVDALEPFTAP